MTITTDHLPSAGASTVTDTEQHDPTEDRLRPVRRKARTAGVLYVVIFLAGPIAFMFGRTGLVVSGDATATAANIVESETMFRIGMLAEVVVVGVEIVLAAILYTLLRPVSRSLSLAAAFARFGEAVVQAVNLATGGIVLALISGASYLAAFETEQLDALVMVFADMNDFLIMVWGLFFGLHLALLGYLVCRSGFWPRALGWMLIAASFGYLAQSSVHLMTTRFDSTLELVVLVLAIPAELAFTAWLLWKGIDTQRWARRHRDAALV